MSDTPRPRLTVIGLDAATLQVVEPLVAEGHLPALGRLLREGSGGVLRSTTHPLTPHAWTTLVTGVNAGRHGIWDFTERDESGYRMRFVNGSFRRAPAVWDRLAVRGRRVGLVGIPFTWPAPRVEGFSVAGFDAAEREEGMTYPPELVAQIGRRYGSIELDNRFPLGKGGRVDLDIVRRAADQKVDLTLWLAERFEPSLLFIVFMAADHIQHLCWTDWERDGAKSPLAEVYRILDERLARVLDWLGPERDVLVVSDHGAGPLHGVVNLNAWLATQGYLAYVPGSARLGRRAVDRLFALRTRVPQGLRTAVKRRLPGLRERVYEREEYSAIDWAGTRAFSYGTFGNIVVNVRGREANGVVAPGDEYERVRDGIAERLLELRGPGGERIVAAVHRREDLFEGPELEKVPDLLVEFDEYAWLGKGNLKSRSESIWDRIEIEPGSEHSYVGSHRHEGLVVLAGPSVQPGVTLSASIQDVAPTLLYLLGEPVPTELEGRVLLEAIDPDLIDRRPPEYEEAAEIRPGEAKEYAAGETAAVEERLRGLGYIE
ncbi:MAG: alkaline phosphatase family protein [Gaiellaceae bacterium]